MLPPIRYHSFTRPLPYASTWFLQERIHNLQLQLRRQSAHPDLLLLLQHRPTYTAGRRQTQPSIQDDRLRLQNLGADFVSATRGGQLTYHGPGQIVGYPLIDLSRYSPVMGARDYVCRIQTFLQSHLKDFHGILHMPSEHTGVFLDPITKIGSIGIQVRHRLTSHGFALNVTREPLPWFNQIVACGLADVQAGSIESKLQKYLSIQDEIPALVRQFGHVFQRDMVKMVLQDEGEIGEALMALENEAEKAGIWSEKPRLM
jgi:lipoate-protein ligase B